MVVLMDETMGLYPWEQRDDEPDNAFRAYKIWRDLPYTDGKERTPLSVARKYSKNDHIQRTPDSIVRWRDEFDWAERTRPYDRYMDRRQQEAVASARDKIAASRGTTIAELETKAIDASSDMLQLIQDKLGDEEWQRWFAPKDATAGLKAVTALLEAQAKLKMAGAEEKKKGHEDATPLSDEEIIEMFGGGSG